MWKCKPNKFFPPNLLWSWFHCCRNNPKIGLNSGYQAFEASTFIHSLRHLPVPYYLKNRTNSHQVTRPALILLCSPHSLLIYDTPMSVSIVAGITGLTYQAWLWFPLDTQPVVAGLLDHRVVLFLISRGIFILSSIKPEPTWVSNWFIWYLSSYPPSTCL